MADVIQPLRAEVTQAGEIVVFAVVLAVVLVVGLALLGLETMVGRHRRRR